ncbi:MAG TPA: family 78 glycoside hydrolase catalytic domain, partial [Caulobacteraceae bacterium]|nr:family 78 glycoside hydrolase catalytic domain [Caulobacteraceae bacterium]
EASRPDVRQVGYELQVAADRDFTEGLVTSGSVATSLPIGAPWPAAPLLSREVRWQRVRVWTDRGETAWSEPFRVEAGLLSDDDWVARPISPVGNVDRAEPAPPALLRRAFRLDQPVAQARLHVSALGVHDTALNGAAVSDALLEPGWTAYRSRLLYAAHDVTALLHVGENVLSAAVGDGWWRGGLTWLERRGVYGRTTALLAQLEIRLADGTELVIATDETWRGGTGALRSADLYNGTDVDLRCEPAGWREAGFDDSGWEAVTALPLPAGLEVRSAPPVRVVEVRKPQPQAMPDGVLRIDAGQNLTGYLRLTANGPVGATIRVRHAELLGADGQLYTATLRKAKSVDSYTLARAAPVTLEPAFTFHGFRYAEIEAAAGVEVTSVEVLVVASDLPASGEFSCSDARVNQLFSNVGWSQRGNFLSLPTDCPQRDERLGWTGDIQVFAQAACANADADAFLASWLRDLALEQRENGCVASVIPNVLGQKGAAWGACGWGDAATVVPWRLYEAYGDLETLQRQYPSMRGWVDWCASRRDAEGCWTGDFQFGDWLDPAAPPDKPNQATTSGDYIATAYLSFSAGLVAKTAALVGDDAAAEQYAELCRQTAAAAWAKWGAEALTTQAGCAVAIELGVVPPGEMQGAADALAALVNRSEGRIATGFLGTPLVLPALCRGGHYEAAYRLLMNLECPGWLHQVRAGATTMWERWDAIRADGSILGDGPEGTPGSNMSSFNHYAYGAVAAWLYRTVAGIAPGAPGYAEVIFAPVPGGGLTHAHAEIATPFGKSGVSWILVGDGALRADLLVAPGSRARFIAPPGYWMLDEPLADVSGDRPSLELGSGSWTIELARR